MKPSHEKKNTRPYRSKGLRTGIDLAFRLLGLISGEMTSNLSESIIARSASPASWSAYNGK
jgi:hypothetical protein